LLLTRSRRINRLVKAAYDGDDKRVATLLANGTDPNGLNRIGVSPLSAAATVGQPAVARLLLDAGADPNVESAESTPLCAGASAHQVSGSPRGGPAAVVALLLAAGADPNMRNSDGTTPLYAGWGDADATRLLLEAGADPNAESTAEAEGLPLCAAAAWGELDVVRLLLQHGADPNRREDSGSGLSPLVWAIRNRHAEVVRALIDAGARNDPNAGPLYRSDDPRRRRGGCGVALPPTV
jgi:ankyrin repeat protein